MQQDLKYQKIIVTTLMIFMVLQPLFDIYYLYLDNVIEIFKFSPATIIRMIVMIFLFICCFLWNKNKKKTFYLVSFLIIFILYALLHNFNSLNFYSAYGNYKYSTFKEMFYLIRMLMPLLLIFITYSSNIKFKQIKIITVITSLIFSIAMIISNVFLFALTSYNFGNKTIKANIFSWFDGISYQKYSYDFIASKGIFHMANQVSATMLILLCLNLLIYFKSKKNYNLITIVLIIISMLMLGTRVAAYGWIASIIAISLSYIIISKFYEKNKINLLKLLLLLITLILGIMLFKYSPVNNRTYSEDNDAYIKSKISKFDKEHNLKKFLSSIKNMEKNAKTKEDYNKIHDYKAKYIKNAYHSYGIDGNYIILYPHDGDVDFWIEEMQKPYLSRSNNRQLKIDITKRVIENNDNKLDYLLGVSFTRMRNAKIYMENDIWVHLYSIGIFGILIFICPYFLIAIWAILWMLRDKRNMNLENCTYVFIIFITFAAGAVSGNVFDEWIVTLFLGFVCGLLLLNIRSNKNKRVLFISSTGGHLDELLQMESLFKKYESYIITEKTKSNKYLKEKYGKVNYLVYGTKDYKFTYIFKFLYNIIKTLFLYIKIKPKVIVTTGTHTAVPMCYIGKIFGSKIIFIETFANSKTKTLAGKLVYPIADTFIVQWESMLKLYPNAIYNGWIY